MFVVINLFVYFVNCRSVVTFNKINFKLVTLLLQQILLPVLTTFDLTHSNKHKHFYFNDHVRNVLSMLPVTIIEPFISKEVRKCVWASLIVRIDFLPSFKSNARMVRSSPTETTTCPLG